MIGLEYHRFIGEFKPTTTEEGICLYKDESQPFQIMKEEDTSYARMKQSILKWEDDHYGYVKIYKFDQDTLDLVLLEEDCLKNRCKYEKDMKKLMHIKMVLIQEDV